MTRILITGGRGFLGRNLAAHLAERKECGTTVFAAIGFARRSQEAAARGGRGVPLGWRQPA